MAFDNRQRVTRLRGAGGPVPFLVAVAVVVLGAALVLGGAFDGGEDLKLNTAIGTTTSPPTSTSTLVPDTSLPEEPTTALPAEVTTTTAAAVKATTTTKSRSPARLASPSGGASATTNPPAADNTQAPATAPATTKPKPPPPTSPPPTEAPAPAPAPAGNRMGSVESDLLGLTNRDRSDAGVGSLTRNSCLDSAASQWAAHMAETGQMAHSTQSGRLVEECRGANASWGDNIGWWDPCVASEMENWWMNSHGHHANIVNGDFDNIGIAVIPGVKNYCWFQVLFSS